MVKGGTMNRRRILLINPKFQFIFVLYSLLIAVTVSVTLFFGVESLFDKILFSSEFRNYDQSNELLKFIEQQKLMFYSYFIYFSVGLCIALSVLGAFVSHKIAGPVYRLVQYIKNLETGESKDPLKFRSLDLFQEIPEVVNSFVEKNKPASEKRNSGFSIIELVVVCAIVSILSLAIVSLTKLSSQAMEQAEYKMAIVGESSNVFNLKKDTQSFLKKMRLKSNISACIPYDPDNKLGRSCPVHNDKLFTDRLLTNKIFGNSVIDTTKGLSSIDLYDSSGKKIAGTDTNPLYLDRNGAAFNNTIPLAEQKLRALFKVTGYMTRENQAVNADPGAVNFYYKIEPNDDNKKAPSIRPIVEEISIGESWKTASAQMCPTGKIQLGHTVSGEAICVDNKPACPANKIQAGYTDSGSPRCIEYKTCSSGEVALFNGSDVTCMQVSSLAHPCKNGSILLGFDGNGKPLCQAPGKTCGEGYVFTGSEIESQQCLAIPKCEENQFLSYNGTNLNCQSNNVALRETKCGPGMINSGLSSVGTVQCRPLVEDDMPNVECPNGQILSGFNSGKKVCKPFLPDDCSEGKVLTYKNGNLSCVSSATTSNPNDRLPSSEMEVSDCLESSEKVDARLNYDSTNKKFVCCYIPRLVKVKIESFISTSRNISSASSNGTLQSAGINGTAISKCQGIANCLFDTRYIEYDWTTTDLNVVSQFSYGNNYDDQTFISSGGKPTGAVNHNWFSSERDWSYSGYYFGYTKSIGSSNQGTLKFGQKEAISEHEQQSIRFRVKATASGRVCK